MKSIRLVSKRSIIIGILILISMALLAVSGGCSGGATGAKVGDKAPDFQLQGSDGEMHALTDYKGSPVMLNFWATWCGPCRGEMPHLEQMYNTWKDRGLVFFAVNSGESISGAQAYMDSFGFTMPVLYDNANTVSVKYGISAIPTTYFIDGDGIIQDKVVGAFPDVASIEEYLETLVP